MEVQGLIDCDVHFFNQDAVSRDAISHPEFHDVSYNDVSHWDLGNGAVGSSKNGNSLVVDLILERQILSLLDPVTGGRDDSREQEPAEDGQRLNVGFASLAENGEGKVDGGSPNQNDDLIFFEVPGEQREERLDGGQSNGVVAEDLLSSLQVIFVSDDSCFHISVEVGAKALVVSAVLENVQRSSALSLVVWDLDVFLQEEQLQVFLSDLEDALVGDVVLRVVLLQLRTLRLVLSLDTLGGFPLIL